EALGVEVIAIETIAQRFTERAAEIRPELVGPEAAADARGAVVRRGRGELGDQADGAAGRSAAVEGGAGPLENVHAGHVGQCPEIAVDLRGVEHAVAVELRSEAANAVRAEETVVAVP